MRTPRSTKVDSEILAGAEPETKTLFFGTVISTERYILAWLIVRIFHVDWKSLGFHRNTLCLVCFEFIDGPTLSDWIHKKSSASPSEAMAVYLFLLDAVMAMENDGWVTPDLKPDNVFVTGPAQ